MADGHARTSGLTYKEVPIGGKKYTLRPFHFGIYPEMEAYIVAQREDPIVWATRACQVAPPSQHEIIWRLAMERGTKARMATTTEMNEFETSLQGIAFKLWVCARDSHPELKTPQDAMNLLVTLTQDEMQVLEAQIFTVSGEADLGNSTGPQTEGQAMVSEILAAGPPSTADSPKSTDGTNGK